MNFLSLYREIGKTLHGLGAERVVLLNSRTITDENYELKLEIAVDGEIDLVQADLICKESWEKIQIAFLDLNDYGKPELLAEVLEDGIQI